MIRAPLRVVVTGYGPFGGRTVNPSDSLGQALSQMPVEGANLEYHRLEVNHDDVDRFMAQMSKNPPDVILSMGVSWKPQLEELPNNRVGGGREGETHPAGPILPGHPEAIATDLPADKIEKALSGFPGRLVGTHFSDNNYQPDRSAYLCNYLNYRLSDAFAGASAQARATTAGFFHITERVSKEEMHLALQTICQHHRESASS
ncbi:hypothetical protein JST97_06080 [bacterium]|nr:hypothetical protein [bacterium]